MNNYEYWDKENKKELWDYTSEVAKFKYDNIIALIPESCESILDIGCHKGELLQRIKNERDIKVMTGVDASQLMLDEAVKMVSDIEFTKLDIMEEKMLKKFDCVIVCDMLQYCSGSELDYILEMMNNKGFLILCLYWNDDNYKQVSERDKKHLELYRNCLKLNLVKYSYDVRKDNNMYDFLLLQKK